MTDVRSPLDPVVDELWERRAALSTGDDDARKAVVDAIDQLDAGTARVAWVDSETDDVVVDERASARSCCPSSCSTWSSRPQATSATTTGCR